uniref:Uncharacterized protein n=1 Tax=Arundo donax TaxID=35708 RepID=A0A0A9C2P2_ARUDO
MSRQRNNLPSASTLQGYKLLRHSILPNWNTSGLLIGAWLTSSTSSEKAQPVRNRNSRTISKIIMWRL